MLRSERKRLDLHHSKEAARIESGIMLVYGDIEVNCTVDTLLDLSRGELAARVAEVLFES